MIGRVAHGESLLSAAFAANDDVLRFLFNPEVRRVICQVGDQSDEQRTCTRRSCTNNSKALGDRTIEMWNHGEHQVRRMLRPISAECFHDRRMIGADRPLQNNQ